MGARDQLLVLVADSVRVLGADNRATMATRHSLAYWTGEAGDSHDAARQLLAEARQLEGREGKKSTWPSLVAASARWALQNDGSPSDVGMTSSERAEAIRLVAGERSLSPQEAGRLFRGADRQAVFAGCVVQLLSRGERGGHVSWLEQTGESNDILWALASALDGDGEARMALPPELRELVDARLGQVTASVTSEA